MNVRQKVEGAVESDKGFYIGDVCYVLNERIYDEYWGDEKYFDDGVFAVPGMCGTKFAVGSTAYGDGSYSDQVGHSFPVDAGNIGLVPIELVEDLDKAIMYGLVVDAAGVAEFKSEDGVFEIKLPNGDAVDIDTRIEEYGDYDTSLHDDDYDEDDYYDEEDDDEDDDF